MFRSQLLSLALVLLLPTSVLAQGATLTLGASASVNLVDPGPITADGKRINLTVVVVDSDGSLAEGARFRGSGAKLGRLDSSCSPSSPGVYVCSYTTPERVASGEELRFKVKLPSGTALDGRYPVELKSSGRARVSTSAAPKNLTLTQDPSSQLSFTIRDGTGAPVSDVDLRASANIGDIEDLHSTGPGLWSARYVPYKANERPFPQIAIVSVWDANNPAGSQDFQVIPLVGKVTFPVKTGVAGSRVVFEVAGKTFPEVTADSSGQANVPIIVPPGVPSAKVELIQPNGSRSSQTIDLMVPPFGRIGLGGLPDFLPADGTTSTPVRLMIIDDKGRPAAGEKVSLTATKGTITQARFLGDGIYEAKFTTPALTASSSTKITASIEGEAGTSSVAKEIALELAGPGNLTLMADPSQLSSSTKKTKLSATLVDGAGQPANKIYSVELRTTDGPLRKVSQDGAGSFSADLSVDWKKKTRVQAVARMRGNKQAVNQLLLLPMHDAVVTGQKTPITVLSLDRYGNPVSSVALNCTATGGGSVTSSAQTDAFGMTAVVFTASPLGGFGTVTCEGGGAKYSAPIWQTPDPMDGFAFPVGGGQDQGRLLARWSKLRAVVDLTQAQVVAAQPAATETPAVTTGTTASGAWGGSAPAATDSGSVGKAGAAANIQVSGIPASVPTTGGIVSLVVKVTDATGILVPGTNVILITDTGVISGKTDNGDGTFSATLTVPANTGKQRIQVTATRPAGDIAGFTGIGIGGAGAAPADKKPRIKAKKPTPAAAGERMARRTARVWGGWMPGSYTYNSRPCTESEGPCEGPADADLDSYDFLKAEVAAPTLGTFSLGGEWFPFQDYVGVSAEYTRASYSTDFQTGGDDGGSHCATNFCDAMNYFNVSAQGRFALLKDKGPLDLLVRVGPSVQDVVVFWRRPNESTGEKEPRFETVNLVGLQIGAGLRYTVTPKIQPHVNYNLTLGLRATLDGNGFGVPGIINHNVVGGVTFFPWKGLMLDASYVGLSRSLGLSFEEAGEIQRGSLDEMTHSVRLSAGWAF